MDIADLSTDVFPANEFSFKFSFVVVLMVVGGNQSASVDDLGQRVFAIGIHDSLDNLRFTLVKVLESTTLELGSCSLWVMML